MSGEKQSFLVQIQFQQNETWQGAITWTEKKLTQHFRSALEMLKLMEEAMRQPGEPKALPTWEDE